MTPKNEKLNKAALFVQALKEDGIDDIYLDLKSNKKDGRSFVSVPQTGGENRLGILNDLKLKVTQCTLCPELVKNRTHVVFGSGNINAQLMFVGEAPGRDEDVQGLPFVGRAGQLLTKIIESIGFERRNVFIANTLKCRPPENRPPQPDEILNCEPFLKMQIAQIRPKIICALGTFASQALLKTGTPISQLRGKFHAYDHGIKVMCTYHPAYLLRNPHDKRKVWDDMKLIKKELEMLS